MFCEKCGNQLAHGSAFCEKCGAPVGNVNANTGVSGNPFSTTSIPVMASGKSVFYYGSILTSVVMVFMSLFQPWVDVYMGVMKCSIFKVLEVIGQINGMMSANMGGVPMDQMAGMAEAKDMLTKITIGVWILIAVVVISVLLHAWSVYTKGVKKQNSKISILASLIYIAAGICSMVVLAMNNVPSIAVSVSGMVWLGIVVSAVNIICTYMASKEN